MKCHFLIFFGKKLIEVSLQSWILWNAIITHFILNCIHFELLCLLLLKRISFVLNLALVKFLFITFFQFVYNMKMNITTCNFNIAIFLGEIKFLKLDDVEF